MIRDLAEELSEARDRNLRRRGKIKAAVPARPEKVPARPKRVLSSRPMVLRTVGDLWSLLCSDERISP